MHDSCVALIHQDSFYKSLTPEQLVDVKNYNFDSPDAFDQVCSAAQDPRTAARDGAHSRAARWGGRAPPPPWCARLPAGGADEGAAGSEGRPVGGGAHLRFYQAPARTGDAQGTPRAGGRAVGRLTRSAPAAGQARCWLSGGSRAQPCFVSTHKALPPCPHPMRHGCLHPPPPPSSSAQAPPAHPTQVDPADVIIVEGILALHFQELREALHMKARRRPPQKGGEGFRVFAEGTAAASRRQPAAPLQLACGPGTQRPSSPAFPPLACRSSWTRMTTCAWAGASSAT